MAANPQIYLQSHPGNLRSIYKDEKTCFSILEINKTVFKNENAFGKLEGDTAHRNMQDFLETSTCQWMMRGDSSTSEGANHLHKEPQKK